MPGQPHRFVARPDVLNFSGLRAGSDPRRYAESSRDPLNRKTPGDRDDGRLNAALCKKLEGLQRPRRDGHVGKVFAKCAKRLAIPTQYFLPRRADLFGVFQPLDFLHARKFSERGGETLANRRTPDECAVEVKRDQAYAARMGGHLLRRVPHQGGWQAQLALPIRIRAA